MKINRFLNYLTPILILVVLLVMTYIQLYIAPNPGFIIQSPDTVVTVIELDLQKSTPTLSVGDRLISINDRSVEEILETTRSNIFSGIEPGELINLAVERNGEIIQIDWIFPGNRLSLVIERFKSSIWWVYMPFWLVGTITLVFIRPQDSKQKLLVWFNFLTALWLAVGSNLSAHRLFEGGLILRSLLWLCVPVYWRLHWNFPGPLMKEPKGFFKILYGASFLMIILEWLGVLPHQSMYISFLLAAGGMLLLIMLQLIFKKAHRKKLRLLAFSVFLAILMVFLLLVPTMLGYPNLTQTGGSILAMPLIPFAYFFTLFRFRFKGFEFRANRAISIYMFLLIVIMPLTILAPLFNEMFSLSPLFTTFALSIVTLFLGIWVYTPFTRFVEKSLLGISIPPEHLLPTYNSKITTTFSFDHLNSLLKKELLPSLMIRQAMLLVKEGDIFKCISRLDDSLSIPGTAFLNKIDSSKNAVVFLIDPDKAEHEWIRLALPLIFENELIGFWLFGRRDPEDQYSPADQQFLRTLADATSSAIKNIQQKDQLRTLYEININRQESEKEALARNLHDLVLNQLAVLMMNLEDNQISQTFDNQYQKLTSSLRQTIQDLRPPTLGMGLATALEELIEDIGERNQNVSTVFDLETQPTSFDPDIEAHLFRITQQACENAINHSACESLKLSGIINPDLVQLEIHDNGNGFILSHPLKLNELLDNHHYGLANMYERASLIGAEFNISSQNEQGTRLVIKWTT